MKICSCCGKEIWTYAYDMSVYAWKFRDTDDGNIKYQCSYTCFRKEEKKLHDKHKQYNRVRCKKGN